MQLRARRQCADPVINKVEHGVTELCYGVDLVKLMLLQAEAEVKGQPGLTSDQLSRFAVVEPRGHAIEVRIYAENPVADYKPSPGLFTDVDFPTGPGIRIDTWLERGSTVTPHFGKTARPGATMQTYL